MGLSHIYFRASGNKGGNVPTQSQAKGVDCALCTSSCREVQAIGELSYRNSPLITNSTQLRIDKNGLYSRLVRGKPVTIVEINRFQNRVFDRLRLNPNDIHAWRHEPLCDCGMIQRHSVICCTSL